MTKVAENPQRIKIVSCKDPLLWYAHHVGEIFNLVRIEQGSKEHYWTREKDPPHYLNWVAEKDAILLTNEEPL